MATHNQVRVVGFLLGNVRLVGNENDGNRDKHSLQSEQRIEMLIVFTKRNLRIS